MFTELPLIETSTPAERLQALRDAQQILAGQPEVTTGGIFGGGSTKPRNVVDTNEIVRLAEYITTGHDYRDTHPEGKRRPIIHNHHTVNVHPVALEVDDEDIPQEIKDFLASFGTKQESAEDDKSAEPDSHLTDEEKAAGLDGK